MAEEKKKSPQFTTPRGVFKYPKLDKPDYGTDQFPKKDGEFNCRLILPGSDPATQALITKLQPLYDAAITAGHEAFAQLKAEQRKKLKELKANDFYSEELDKDTEEPTGNLEFKFKVAYATKITKGKRAGETWYRYPALFDAKGKPLNKYDDKGKVILQAPPIWGGSQGKITFDVRDYFISGQGMAGLSFGLLAVQVIERVSGSDRNASQYGFGEEEGYSAEDDTSAQPAEDAASNDTAGDEPDDF